MRGEFSLTWTTLKRSEGLRCRYRISNTWSRFISLKLWIKSRDSLPPWNFLLTVVRADLLVVTSSFLLILLLVLSLSVTGFCLKRGDRLLGTSPRVGGEGAGAGSWTGTSGTSSVTFPPVTSSCSCSLLSNPKF